MIKTNPKTNIRRISAFIIACSFLSLSCQLGKVQGQAPTVHASFTYSPAAPVAEQDVQFTDTSTGSPTSWRWSFGDGATSTVQNPSHTFATASSYTVTLTVSNSSSSNSTNQAINVLSASTLTASFTFIPASPVAGQTVQFRDTSIGIPTSWRWNFGDGATSSAQNPGHSYSTVSSYTVTLTVSNNSASDRTSRSLNVLPTDTLMASFSYTPSSPVVGQAVQFTDTSTGSPTSWQWSFGDGSTSTVRNPSYTYTTAGPYSVSLTVSAGSGSNSTNQTIAVRQPNTITAASPSFADVSAAIALANSGDTVIVPAGAATWSSQLAVTKAIRLIGAGVGNTTITSSYSGYVIKYQPASPNPSDLFRLSGFTFNMGSVSGRHFLILVNKTSTSVYVRVDHNSATGNDGYCIEIGGVIYGVIDNNTLSSNYYILSVYGNNESSWRNLTFQLGTSENLYFEDNTCASKNVFHAGGAGGRYCARHNTYTFTSSPLWPWFDQHGNQGSGTNLSGMGTEIYENTLIDVYNGGGLAFDHRGGIAVCYNNNIISTGSFDLRCREEYNDNLNPPATSPDGQPQHVSGSYYWNNTQNGSRLIDPYIGDTVDYGGSIGIVPQWNRDCWKQVTPFNGTTGMGVGLLADRPASGVLGVGYWATDVKKLYTWTANNGWEEYYTPYPYPHPLRNAP